MELTPSVSTITNEPSGTSTQWVRKFVKWFRYKHHRTGREHLIRAVDDAQGVQVYALVYGGGAFAPSVSDGEQSSTVGQRDAKGYPLLDPCPMQRLL